MLRTQAVEAVKVEDEVTDSDAVVAQFKQVIIQSAVDLACRQQADTNCLIASLHASWEEIKSQVVDIGELDTYSVPAPKKLKTDYEFKVTHLMSAYADVIKNLFFERPEGPMRLSLIQEFSHVENTCAEYGRESFELIWALLEAQLSSLGKDMSSEDEVQALIDNTCSYLELQFADKISQVVRKANRQRPIDQVKEFCYLDQCATVSKSNVDVQDLEYDAAGEAPWTVLFYLMRSGRYDTAVTYASSNSLTKGLVPFMQTYYSERGLLSYDQLNTLVDMISVLETTDVYHRAVLAILGRYNFELDELQSSSLEDYLWIKLKLVNTHASSGVYASLSGYQYTTFKELRSNFSNSDPSAFKGKPLLYTFALVASLCYGEAIQFLHSHDRELEAVHLAIALKERRLLPYLDSQRVLFESIGDVMHVNYDQLLQKYLRHLEYPSPNSALAYIGLMDNDQAIVIAASDLVISTQNYQIVLNQDVYWLSSLFKDKLDRTIPSPNRVAPYGSPNSHEPQGQLYIDIVKRIAHFAAEQNSVDAVRLFDLINEKAEVMELIIKQSQNEVRKLRNVWQENRTILDARATTSPTNRRSFFTEKYSEFFEKYNVTSMQKYLTALNSLDILLTFYTWLLERHYMNAAECILNSLLSPYSASQEGIPSSIKRAHSAVKEELPDAIVIAISLLDQLSRLKDCPYSEDIALEEMKSLTNYFNDLEAYLRDLPTAWKRWKELSRKVMEIKSQLLN